MIHYHPFLSRSFPHGSSSRSSPVRSTPQGLVWLLKHLPPQVVSTTTSPRRTTLRSHRLYFQGNSARAASTILVRVRQLLPEINDAQIMGILASLLFSQETEASADQPEMYHSGTEVLDDAHHCFDQTFGNPIAWFSHWSTGTLVAWFSQERESSNEVQLIEARKLRRNPESQEFLKLQ